MSFSDPTMGARAVARCDALGAPPYSERDDSLLRPYLTRSHRAALDALGGWMAEAGMEVRLDPVGNLIGRYEGATPDAPILLLGSHIDTVPGGGRYDGALGVMLAVEVVAALSQEGRRLPFAIEVIAFGDEEGSRFAASMLCSRAVAGLPLGEALDVQDQQGVTIAEGLMRFGLDPARAHEAAYAPGRVLAFVEAHIEQGPILEDAGISLGVVTGIAAQVRLLARFTGMAGHAGTTPMRLRRDALAGASEAVLAVERVCRAEGGDLVGTVGKVQTSTSAFNVIVGEAEVSIDLRAGDVTRRDAAAAKVRQVLAEIATARGLTLEMRQVQSLEGCTCDPRLMHLLEEAAGSINLPTLRLMSGAGHDGISLAALAPVGMLFIRCEGGVSHNAAEAVTADDADDAARALLAFFDALAKDRGSDDR